MNTDPRGKSERDRGGRRETGGPDPPAARSEVHDPARPACPACGGPLVERRMKLVCARCGTICETCCEGGRG